MGGKCQTLVRTRRSETGAIIYLKAPEPCGIEASMYQVKAKERLAKRGREDDPQMKFMGVHSWKIKTGSMTVTGSFCVQFIFYWDQDCLDFYPELHTRGICTKCRSFETGKRYVYGIVNGQEAKIAEAL